MFAWFGGERGDDPQVFATPGVDDDQQTASCAYPKSDESFLIRVRLIVGYRYRVGIIENLLYALFVQPASIFLIDVSFTDRIRGILVRSLQLDQVLNEAPPESL